MESYLILIAIGLLALAGELFLPSGIIGVLGIGLVVCGSLLMLGIEPTLSAAAGLGSSIVAGAAVLLYAKHLAKIPAKTGGESFVGLEAVVKTDFRSGKGVVEVKSETWTCRSASGKNHKKGTRVKITGFQGVHLKTD